MPLCDSSVKKGECLNDDCKKRHISGTRRTNSRPICPSSQSSKECFDSDCKLHHVKGTVRRKPPGAKQQHDKGKPSDQSNQEKPNAASTKSSSETTTAQQSSSSVETTGNFLDVAQIIASLRKELMPEILGAIDSRFSSMQGRVPTNAATSHFHQPQQMWLPMQPTAQTIHPQYLSRPQTGLPGSQPLDMAAPLC